MLNFIDSSSSLDPGFSLSLHSDLPTCHDTASLLSVVDAGDVGGIFQFIEELDDEEKSQLISEKELLNNMGQTLVDKEIKEKEITEKNFLRPRRPITTGNLERKREIRLKNTGAYIQMMMRKYGISQGDSVYVYRLLQMDPDHIDGLKSRKLLKELASLR